MALPLIWLGVAAASALAAGAFHKFTSSDAKSPNNANKTKNTNSNTNKDQTKNYKTYNKTKSNQETASSEIDDAYDEYVNPTTSSKSSGTNTFDHTKYNAEQRAKFQQSFSKKTASSEIDDAYDEYLNPTTSSKSSGTNTFDHTKYNAEQRAKFQQSFSKKTASSEIDDAYDEYLNPTTSSKSSGTNTLKHITNNKEQYNKLQTELPKQANLPDTIAKYNEFLTKDSKLQTAQDQRRAKRFKLYLPHFIKASGYTIEQFEKEFSLPSGFIMFLNEKVETLSVTDYDKYGKILIYQHGPQYITTSYNDSIESFLLFLVENPAVTSPSQRKLMEQLLKKLGEITISNDSNRERYAQEISIHLHRLIDLFVLNDYA